MIAKFLTKVLPYDGEHVYYDGQKMTPNQAAQCVYAVFAIAGGFTAIYLAILYWFGLL